MEWVQSYTEFLFRWIHVAAGIVWIGHLYFFNFVNAHVAKTYDADSKKKVVPELMPRSLYWFRWGAMYTWISGIFLLAFSYYMANNMVPEGSTMSNGTASILCLVILFVAFFIYDIVWKAVKNETVGAVISFLLVVAVLFGLSRILIGRSVYIHIGAFFGTVMFMNVWMRIWPAQKKIIAGIKGTAAAADPSVVALAGLRSKHNTYMSVPLAFFMVSNHYPGLYGNQEYGWLIAAVIVLVGWLLTKFLYVKSASAAPTKIGD
ncbi:urate hydroxylase PuuD [bacterium]|nr:urate hydroxylase PuuD [bacterium]MCI0602177.1 urate hydroxylase PuuD [bacterium]